MSANREMLSGALDAHIRKVQQEGRTELAVYPAGVLLTYGDLRDRAKYRGIAQSVGRFLTHIAEEHRKAGRPPADCLVVSKKHRQPGSGFSSGGEFNSADWERAVEAVVNHKL